MISQCALCHSYKPYETILENSLCTRLTTKISLLYRYVQLCESIVHYNHYLAKEYHKENLNNVHCFVVF